MVSFSSWASVGRKRLHQVATMTSGRREAITVTRAMSQTVGVEKAAFAASANSGKMSWKMSEQAKNRTILSQKDIHMGQEWAFTVNPQRTRTRRTTTSEATTVLYQYPALRP